MSAPKPGQYGEPWKARRQVDGNGHAIVTSLGYEPAFDLPKPDVERIVACVNALDGLDPEALKGLIEAAREAVAGCCTDEDACCYCNGSLADEHIAGCPVEKLSAALAAFGVTK